MSDSPPVPVKREPEDSTDRRRRSRSPRRSRTSCSSRSRSQRRSRSPRSRRSRSPAIKKRSRSPIAKREPPSRRPDDRDDRVKRENRDSDRRDRDGPQRPERSEPPQRPRNDRDFKRERAEREKQHEAMIKQDWGKPAFLADKGNEEEPEEEGPKETFTLATSGLLQASENVKNGVITQYSEPSDKHLPDKRWKMFVFKEGKDDPVETLPLHRQSCYLFGREDRIADFMVAHPSCSKQHAVLQFRNRGVELPDGSGWTSVIKPYLIDLNSTNGTYINGTRNSAARYYELFEKDVIKFGFSTREYVLMTDKT